MDSQSLLAMAKRLYWPRTEAPSIFPPGEGTLNPPRYRQSQMRPMTPHRVLSAFACLPGLLPASVLLAADLGRTVLPIAEPKTQPFTFSADGGTDAGVGNESNVSPAYKPGSGAFTGRILKVTVAQK